MKNRMFGGEEPTGENPSPRTTIVGGRPPERASAPPPVPTGLQRLLRLASVDPAFRDELLARRAAVAPSAGVELGASERAVLAAAPREQLAAMIASLPPPPTDRRTFLKEGAVAALAALTGTIAPGCEREPILAGATVQEPPSRPPGNVQSAGIRPQLPPLPKYDEAKAPPEDPPPRPDASERERPKTRGIRADFPPIRNGEE